MTLRIEGIEEQELRYLHDDEEMSQPSLALYYRVSRQVIRNRMIEYGIKPHTISEAKIGRSVPAGRMYSINEDFFKTWTPESAWVFGWALGDGSYTSNWQLNFSLSRKDKEVIYKFRNVMESYHPVADYVSTGNSEMSRVVFNSIILVDDLKHLSYHDVPSKQFSHFVRGFFEAEGCVDFNQNVVRTRIAQNDYDMLDFIYWCLHEFEVVNGGSISKHGNGWDLSFSKYDSISLYHYMYDECGDMFLERKKEKFEELIGD